MRRSGCLRKSMRIVVIGTRGIPGIQGGVETHCEELYPRIASLGHDVTVMRRRSYVTDNNRAKQYKGVKLVDLYAPRGKSLEAIVHTTLAVFKARRLKPDVLHIHGIGPGILTPVARLMGMKVVLTVHSFNYDHDKWNRFGKSILRLGERLSTRWANRIISISQPIKESLESRYKDRNVELIFNGVNKPQQAARNESAADTGRKPYMLALGRLVPEKGFDILIKAFAQSGLKDKYDLVIAGEADHATPYSEQLKADAREAGIIMPGYITGEPLRRLMAGTDLFLLPSRTEGLPIALLEAMSYGLDVLVSDIPANRLPQLAPDDFFKAGDVDNLAARLNEKAAAVKRRREYDLEPYNWDNIARRTVEVYNSLK